MNRLILAVGAIIACASLLWAQDKSEVPEGWTKISICHLSFYAPPELKKSDINGIDSCVARYANKDISVYLDYGLYGGPTSASGNELEWIQESRSVGGKDAQITTFVDATNGNSSLKYIGALYMVVKPVDSSREREWRQKTLMMSVTSERRTDRDAALAIFRTIRFE